MTVFLGAISGGVKGHRYACRAPPFLSFSSQALGYVSSPVVQTK